jgi:uncharacterized protein YbcI
VGTAARASLYHPQLLAALKPGDQLWMDDGTIQLVIEGTDPREAHCRVMAGGVVSDHKGVSLPGLPLPVSCLTAKDKEDLRFGIKHGVDYVAVSFVRSSSDIQEVRKFLLEQRASLPIIAKLERAEIVANLSGILTLVDAVMVARGDLGVEVPIEEVPVIQKDVIRRARLGKVPVIVATHMLESMVRHVRPSRAPQTFMKIGPRNAMVIAVCSLALVVDRERGEVRAAFGSAAPVARLVTGALDCVHVSPPSVEIKMPSPSTAAIRVPSNEQATEYQKPVVILDCAHEPPLFVET